jgi:trimeric autotransporter adhesin
MNPLIQLKRAIPLSFVALACFGLVPRMQAVVPAPDGGYAGFNTAEGTQALFHLNIAGGGTFNTALGGLALFSDTTGQANTAVGLNALRFNTIGFHNTANGFDALLFNMIGNHNTATGDIALMSNTRGNFNTADGAHTLAGNTTGSSNTALGFGAGDNVTTASNVICIGSLVVGANVSNSCFIGSVFGQTSPGGVAVFIDSSGKLGTSTSSRRFKEEIKPMERTSEALFALKPVTFRYKKEIDASGTSQFGLVAEEVEKVNRDLVVRDKDGRPYSVRYEQVNAMLLNEFLKEHRKNQRQESKIAQQEAKIARQQKQIDALAAGLQKVSAQLEASKPAPQVVNNP